MLKDGSVERPQGIGRIFSSLGRITVSRLGFAILVLMMSLLVQFGWPPYWDSHSALAGGADGPGPADITVVNQDASPRAAAGWPQYSPVPLLSDQVEIRRRVEQYFQEKVRAVLDPVVGPGRSTISVTADIDFDRVERTEEWFDPQDSVLRAEDRSQEILTLPESEFGEVEGISANLPADAPREPERKPPVRNQKTSRSYEIGRTVEHVIREPGTIRKLSVCAVVDGTYVSDDGDGTGARRYVPRTEEEIATFRKIITASIGESVEPSVEVINVPIDTVLPEQRTGALQAGTGAQPYSELYGTAIRWTGIVVVALLCFLILRYVLRTLLTRHSAAEPVPAGLEDIAQARSGISPETRVLELADEIGGMVRQNPDEVVSLLRRWLVEQG